MVRLNRIYTRTGDAGETGLVDGSRVGKDDARIAAVGDVDELNCAIGLAALLVTAMDLRPVQNDLFDLGADLATPGGDFTPGEMVLRITADQVRWIEQAIDRLNASLDPLRSFILPGGTEAAARVHMARAVARRAERGAVALGRIAPVNPQALAYLNRLSDLLFVLARVENGGGTGDILWVPGAGRT